LDEKRFSRITVYKDGPMNEGQDKLDELRKLGDSLMNKIITTTTLLLMILVIVLTLGCSVDHELSLEPDEPEEITESEPPLEEQQPEIEPEPDQELKVIVNVDVLRLRSGPSTDHDILDRLMLGTLLQVTGSDNEWIQVITPDGKEGWVHGDYIAYQNDYTSHMEHALSTDIQKRIYNCKIMKVFQMSFEEVLNILGEPDETIWLAGDVYIWDDASELIGNNEDGLSEQKELLIGGESIKAINFKEFGDIKIGMSFQDAEEILGADLETFDTEGSEWFQYAMVYEYEEYSIIFGSADSASPIRMIMVWRF
jgi:hypothetical protein